MDRIRHTLRDEKSTHHQRSFEGIFFLRYSLSSDYQKSRLEKQPARNISRRYTQRKKAFFKGLDAVTLINTYWNSIAENKMYPQPPNPNYPQQYPQPQALPQPSPADYAALLAQLQQLQADKQDRDKKDRMATYHVRRAKGSGNLSVNWGPEQIQGAYLTPIKYQDGRCFVSGSGMPATFQINKTAQGTFLTATIQNGPWNDEELALWNELFTQPVQVIPQRRGPKGTATTPQAGQPIPSAPQQPPMQAPQYPPQAQPPAQYPPQPQYQQPPVQMTQPQPFQGQPGSGLQSIAHLPADVQQMIVADANLLMQRVPTVYTSLDLAIVAAKKAKNIP